MRWTRARPTALVLALPLAACERVDPAAAQPPAPASAAIVSLFVFSPPDASDVKKGKVSTSQGRTWCTPTPCTFPIPFPRCT